MSIAQSEASEARRLPIIDVSGLQGSAIDRHAVARELRLACTNTGFFYITGHGIPTGYLEEMVRRNLRGRRLSNKTERARLRTLLVEQKAMERETRFDDSN